MYDTQGVRFANYRSQKNLKAGRTSSLHTFHCREDPFLCQVIKQILFLHRITISAVQLEKKKEKKEKSHHRKLTRERNMPSTVCLEKHLSILFNLFQQWRLVGIFLTSLDEEIISDKKKMNCLNRITVTFCGALPLSYWICAQIYWWQIKSLVHLMSPTNIERIPKVEDPIGKIESYSYK